MQCTECGTTDGNIKKYELDFGMKCESDVVFKAVIGRQFCQKCAADNANLLKSELEFMNDNDDIPAGCVELNIFISDSLLKSS